MTLLLALLAGYGLTNILVYSKIAERIRILLSKKEFTRELIGCSTCTGWWAGIFVALVSLLPGTMSTIILMPFAVSGVSWALDRLTTLWDDEVFYLNKDRDK